MASDYQEWVIHPEKARRARLLAERDGQGDYVVVVHLQNVAKDEPSREVACSLDSLERIARRGDELKDSLEFKSRGKVVGKPDGRLELADCKAYYYALVTDDKRERLDVIVESKSQKDLEGRPARVVSDLDKLREYAEKGRGYETALSLGEVFRHVVAITPGRDRDKAVARVVAQSFDGTVDEKMTPPAGARTRKGGDEFAHANRNIYVMWPKSMRFTPVETSLTVSKTGDPKIDNVIELAHFHPERRSENYVVAQWALDSEPPERGRKGVQSGGLATSSNGEPLDFLASFDGQADGTKKRPGAPYLLIRLATRTESSEVVGVYPTRKEAVEAHQEAVNRDLTHAQAMGPDWSQHLTPPRRPGR